MKALPLLGALLLCGCGSDYQDLPAAPAPSDPPFPGSQVPTSATTGSAAATHFVRTSAASSSEEAEPLELGQAQLAVDDDGEPAP